MHLKRWNCIALAAFALASPALAQDGARHEGKCHDKKAWFANAEADGASAVLLPCGEEEPAAVLAKGVPLPITQWRYKVETDGVKHIGPVAQDFHAAFGLGESDTAITTVDADGVALAAIQGLNQKLEEREALLRQENAELKQKNTEMETRLSALEKLIHRLSLRRSGGGE